MRILVKTLILVGFLLAIDFAVLGGRYSGRIWQHAQHQGQAIAADVARWATKFKP